MKNSIDQIDDVLLGRWLTGELSDDEKAQITHWASLKEENREILNDLEKIMDNIRLLPEMESIDSMAAIEKVKSRIHHKAPLPNRMIRIWQRIAAVIVLPLLAYTLYQATVNHVSKLNDQAEWVEMSTPIGLRSEFNLPDGTKVWLNGNTHLKYPKQFNKHERLVSLQGEAFFEVSSNRKAPFIVSTGELMIQAVGTSFNVSAFPEDIVVETALLEGKVILLRETMLGKSRITSLEPGQFSVYYENTGLLRKSEENLDKHIAWREGKFLFRNDPLEVVLKELGRWYNVEFRISEEIEDSNAYTGTFQGESLRQILEYIEYTTPIEFVFSDPDQREDLSFTKPVIKVIHKYKVSNPN